MCVPTIYFHMYVIDTHPIQPSYVKSQANLVGAYVCLYVCMCVRPHPTEIILLLAHHMYVIDTHPIPPSYVKSQANLVGAYVCLYVCASVPTPQNLY